MSRKDRSLPDRVSLLCGAILRINSSLDIGVVLREIVESTRGLTGAHYGMITTIGDSGELQEFVSSGLTPEEDRQLQAWPVGPQLFEHLRDLAGPLRVTDFHGYARSLGYSPHPVIPKIFQGTPMRFQGAQVGTFFLANKEGGREFTNEDEEILMLFASQAAAAIANARTHEAEKRARADLEALVDISPVGVVVIDARTGNLVLLNREAQRIVQRLCSPGQTVEQLLEIVTCRRADGSEVSLEQFPLAQTLKDATPVRSEEIVFEVADGRSVSALINATPMQGKDGAIESVIVTLQDLAPLEETERLRTNFLDLVSHEMRVPLTSIKGSATTALRTSPDPNLGVMRQFFRIIDEQADRMHSLLDELLDAGRIETGTLAVDPEPTEVVRLVDQARSTFLSGSGRQTIHVDLAPGLPRVMADRQRIAQVLNNLLANASKHSPESSTIRISAKREEVHVAISVSDEGQGVPPELLPRLFQKHVRLGKDRGSGGSGLGLSICKGLVEAHGGRIWAESGGTNQGTRFTFTIPVANEAGIGDTAGFARSALRPTRNRRERHDILVVDDDPQTLRYVRDVLVEAGYSPLLTGDPAEMSRLIKKRSPRLVLLDLMLPNTDGIELMEHLPELADLPVIFISGYGRDETVARALGAGAADYIVKPFSPTELVARVQAALRRTDETPGPFRLGDLAIDYEERRVSVAGSPVRLTATEYELLRVLSANAGRVTTYGSLLRQVWGQWESHDLRPMRSVVTSLRRKLGDDAARPSYIVTVRQVGYRMGKPSGP